MKTAGIPSGQVGLRAVLFDLDGTLVDSAPDIAAAVNELMTAQAWRRTRSRRYGA